MSWFEFYEILRNLSYYQQNHFVRDCNGRCSGWEKGMHPKMLISEHYPSNANFSTAINMESVKHELDWIQRSSLLPVKHTLGSIQGSSSITCEAYIGFNSRILSITCEAWIGLNSKILSITCEAWIGLNSKILSITYEVWIGFNSKILSITCEGMELGSIQRSSLLPVKHELGSIQRSSLLSLPSGQSGSMLVSYTRKPFKKYSLFCKICRFWRFFRIYSGKLEYLKALHSDFTEIVSSIVNIILNSVLRSLWILYSNNIKWKNAWIWGRFNLKDQWKENSLRQVTIIFPPLQTKVWGEIASHPVSYTIFRTQILLHHSQRRIHRYWPLRM